MRVTLPWPMRLRAAAAFFLWAALAAGAFADEHVWTSRGPTDVAWVTDAAIADGTAYAGTLNGVFRSVDRGIDLAVLRPERPVDQPGRRALGSQRRVRPARAAIADRRSLCDAGRRRDVDEGPVERELRGRRSGRSVDRLCRTGRRSDREVGGLRVELECALESSLPTATSQAIAFDTRAIYVITYEGLFQQPGRRRLLGSRPADRRSVAISGRNGRVVRDSLATALLPDLGLGADLDLQQPPRRSHPHRRDPTGRSGCGSAAAGVLGSRAALQRRLRRDVGAARRRTWNHSLHPGPRRGRGFGIDRGRQTTGECSAARTRELHGQRANAGLQSTWIRALALDPSNPSNLWAGASVLFRPEGPGCSTRSTPASPGRRREREVRRRSTPSPSIPSDSSTILAGNAGTVFRSEDGGATWSSSRVQPVRDILRWRSIRNRPTESLPRLVEGLKRSEDGGRTWITTPTVAQTVYSILFDQRRPEKVYAGSFYDYSYSYYGYYSYPQGGSIFVSVDHGVNFTKSEDIGGPVLSIAQDPFRENVLYAGGAGVSTSLDGGTHWRRASAGLTVNFVSALAADPVRPGHIYAATEQGSLPHGRRSAPLGAVLGRPGVGDRLDARDLAGRKSSACRDGRRRRVRRRSPRASSIPLRSELHAAVPRRKSIRRGSRGRAEGRHAIRPGRGALPGRPGRLFRASEHHRRPGSAGDHRQGARRGRVRATRCGRLLHQPDDVALRADRHRHHDGGAAGLREQPRITHVRRRGPGVRGVRGARFGASRRRPSPRPRPLSKCSAAASP